MVGDNNGNVQPPLPYIPYCVTGMCADPCGLLCRSFSQHQYFDSQGLFLSLLLSLPIILNCTVMVVRAMHTPCSTRTHVI